MSSDTANLLRKHVKATADLLTNEKPDRDEKEVQSDVSIHDAKRTDTGKAK